MYSGIENVLFEMYLVIFVVVLVLMLRMKVLVFFGRGRVRIQLMIFFMFLVNDDVNFRDIIVSLNVKVFLRMRKVKLMKVVDLWFLMNFFNFWWIGQKVQVRISLKKSGLRKGRIIFYDMYKIIVMIVV